MMRKLAVMLISSSILLYSTQAASRDDRLRFPVQDAMSTDAAKEKLDAGVRFYFGDQKHPAVQTKLGEFTSNKKTNAFGKSDKNACEWAFLSAMISLQERALREGGNAVINISSNYKSVPFKSSSEYECGAGAIMAGVTLVGRVVKLK